MHELKHDHHGLKYLNLETGHQRYSPNPGRAHRERLLWAGAALMLALMLLYVARSALAKGLAS